MAGRFLNLFKPIGRILPEIKVPERKVKFNEKIFWTALVLIVFLVMSEVPLFGMVSRLVKQKGIDILAAAIHRILDLDLQIVLLGSGEPWTHFYFGDIAARYPGKFRCHIGFSNPLAHLVEAGSNFFLMPSAFEPCGLNQMYSLRYGTIPVVRAVGGLKDSVEHFEERNLTGTGFTFRALTPDALIDTVGWAVWTWYHNEEGMASLIRNGMARRFASERPDEYRKDRD